MRVRCAGSRAGEQQAAGEHPRCPLLQIRADSLSEPARGGRLQSESRFRGGGGLGGTVRRRGMGWGRRGAGAHHLEARGRLQRVDRRGRLSGVILSIWRIESEQAKRRVGAQSRRRRAHYVGGLQGAWSDPPPPLPLPRTPLVGAPGAPGGRARRPRQTAAFPVRCALPRPSRSLSVLCAVCGSCVCVP